MDSAGLYPFPAFHVCLCESITHACAYGANDQHIAYTVGPRPSGHQVIRGVLLYRSCSSQGTEVHLFLHGPGHFLGVAFGILAQLGLCVDVPGLKYRASETSLTYTPGWGVHVCPQALLWPDCTLSQLVCMFSFQITC